MAPLQHHFELAGWAETTIVVRFWLIAGMFVALGLGIFYVGWFPKGLSAAAPAACPHGVTLCSEILTLHDLPRCGLPRRRVGLPAEEHPGELAARPEQLIKGRLERGVGHPDRARPVGVGRRVG
jgi:hypothetical protein